MEFLLFGVGNGRRWFALLDRVAATTLANTPLQREISAGYGPNYFFHAALTRAALVRDGRIWVGLPPKPDFTTTNRPGQEGLK
jgi:hypothetical protein